LIKMGCSDITAFVGETRDAEGGSVRLDAIGAAADQAIISVTTPWGATDNYETIKLNRSLSFTKDTIKYTVTLKNVVYSSYRSTYFCKFEVCRTTITPPATPTPTPTPTPAPTKCRQEFRVYNGLIHPAAGAKVTVNGIVYTTNSDGYASALLTVGKEYTATAKYEDRSKTYKFTACGDLLRFRLVTIVILDGFVYCEAYDSTTNAELHATIKANGVTQPKLTPGKTWNLRAGEYTIKFVLDGYVTVTRTVTVTAGQTVNLTVSMTRIQTPTPTPVPITHGILHSISNPVGATIFIKDLSLAVPFYLNYGVTNKYNIELKVGSYTVKYTKPGYKDYVAQLTIGAGRWYSISAMLVPVTTPTPTPTPKPTPVPNVGYIKCQAYDSVTNKGLNATLRIDNTTIVPKTPHTTPGISAGTHTVTFILEGYITKTISVTVRAGETVNAYGSMVKEALPDVTGFDVKVNIPGILPRSSLHIQQVVKVPLTNTWWRHPIGHGMRWDNVSNGVYKARARSADSSPIPSFHTGFGENEDYAVYIGTSAVAFYPGTIVHKSTGAVTEIDITSSYVDWVSSKVCAAMDITPANCPFFIASSVNDAAFFLELWTIITKHENLAGEPTTPTALDYALFPIAIFGMLSPGISEGKIVQIVGKRVTELIPLSRKGTPEIKAVMQDPGLDTFLLRATDSQFNDFVKWIEAGADGTARNLLKTVDEAPLSKNDLHALQRASKFVEALDPKLIKAGSLESLKTVLKNFSPKFTKVFESALKWVTEHPSETVTVGSAGIVVIGLWYALSKLTGNVDESFKASGITMSSTSWGGKDYLSSIEIYKYNVIDAERLENWTLFCENLLAWEQEVNNFEVFVTANQAKLNIEGYYGIFTNTIAAYRAAIEIKNEVHSCIEDTLPELINAEVMEILDSDTVRVRYNDSDYTVRLLGINAPEGKTYNYTCTGVRSPYLIRRLLTPGKECIEEETWTGTEEIYNASKVWLSQYLPVHQIAQFHSDSARQFDKYGRLLAVPFYNGKNVCMESLKAGQSVVFFYDYNKQVNTGAFLAAEQTAKDAKIGVWEVEAGFGSIRCVSTPTAAEVWLDGVYTGKKTISSIAWLYNVPVGEHTVEFKKIIDGVSHACSKTITVVKGVTALAECILISGVTPTPTPTPPITPTPTPTPEKAIWQIGDVKNEAGAVLGAAKVFVDDVYLAHYAPETLTFCTDCACDAVVPCGFGTHTVTIKKTGYEDWSKTRTLGPGDSFTDNPIMSAPAPGTFPVTFVSKPSGATIKVDGKAI
jgi:endonuclease YncB( thermonuclease family)